MEATCDFIARYNWFIVEVLHGDWQKFYQPSWEVGASEWLGWLDQYTADS